MSNYREYGYDVNSKELAKQISEDNKEANEIEKRVNELRNEKKEQIASKVLFKDNVLEEEIEEVLNSYAFNGNEYLTDGAILTCDRASLEPISIDIDHVTITFPGNNSQSAKFTKLKASENGQSSNGLYMATVGDAVQGENIDPFRCNCALLPDRQWEIDKIKKNMGYCKTYGTCSQLMNLNDEWKNMPSSTKYFTYTDKSKGVSEEKEGINMISMLFCKHGGLITLVSSGQIKINLSNVFGDFNLEKEAQNGNPLAIKLVNMNFSQEKVNLIIEATKDIYQQYYIVIDPICLLSIIAQEGTGSFNTSSSNLAADGQHGYEKNFAIDLIRANDLIFGKILGFVLYGEEFINTVNANKKILGVEQGNFAQYANWATPFINFSHQTMYAAPYAGHAQWHENLEFFYESVRGENSVQRYTEYIVHLDKRMIDSILQDNNISAINGSFKVVQNGQDSNGKYNGTYIVVWENK